MRTSKVDKQRLKGVIDKYMKHNGKPDWKQIALEMGEGKTPDYYRIWWSRHGRILPKHLKKPLAIYGSDLEEVTALRNDGYNVEVWIQDGQVFAQIKQTLPIGTTTFASLQKGSEKKIAILSDTHIGHINFNAEALNNFYKYAHSKGVTEFYHCGDMTDGMYKERDTSFYEQNAHGFQEQFEMVVDVYPCIEGVTTYFITGNHDITHLRNGGADIGRVIERARHDMVYLGHNYAKVWLTDKVDLEMRHPTDGSTYAISHKLQKIIDAKERRSKILAIGHYHKMCWVYYKGVHGFVVPAFEKQTNFMDINNLSASVGGLILTLKLDKNGDLLSLTPEYVDFEGE